MSKARLWKVLLVSSVLFVFIASAASQELQLKGPPEPVTAGFFQLSFTGAENPRKVIIQRSVTADFTDITSHYSPMGHFNKLALSGFSSGEYYFRAQEQGHTSNIVVVSVQHHSLLQAFILFFIGAAMFVLLVATLVRYQLAKHASNIRRLHA
ncbi:hypothetical protein [Aliidiomarina quisquiliarum]|uniref:hypothetical protein n=1 Tax=Aliidiomarina quisquiliarum TaxID=2938947 RepID=UPI00208FA703|nr:hypothetical protein [Aliidiomarina quisquiliarum]MCO4320396.1 hypothetical protein [Aliidiomarina quisquiliarum]